jgi:hypothetical protein
VLDSTVATRIFELVNSEVVTVTIKREFQTTGLGRNLIPIDLALHIISQF